MINLPRLMLACVLLAAPALSVHATTPQPPLIPMRDFFRNPEKTSYQLSPDGLYLAWLQPWESRLNIHVQRIGSPEVRRVTSATERDIRNYTWKGNSRLVWLQDKGGDEDFHLFTVAAEGGETRELTPFDKVRAGIIDRLEDHPTDMIISMNQRNPRLFDAHRVNVETGEITLSAENPGNVTGWQTDWDGRIRVAVASDGVNSKIFYRADETEPFQTVLSTNFREQVNPLYFDFDNRSLYVSSNLGRDKSAIVRVDPQTMEEQELLFDHPEVDVSSLMVSRHRKKFTGVSFTVAKTAFHFFDDERRRLQDDLEQRLPGYEVRVTNMSRDEKRVLVRTFSDKSLGAFYFYDTITGEFAKLVDVSPWLDESHMADMQPITFQSRDGLSLHGYLTLPKGVPPTNLPTVINPHGGPWARDTWGFNPEVQFLANRGYAVLQVNFRGSTGFGRKFWESSFKQWGKTMQDDLTDGVQWLISQRIADSKRVGIYGGSYGGYAALAGLAFTPEVYAAGVSYVGVSNIFTLLDSIPPYWEPMRQQLYEMVGNPKTEEALVRAASPLFSVDQMRAPLLVIQGARDPRVKKAESDQIVEALNARGIDVPYLVKDNEGHGFANEENRFEAYAAIEKFFSKHLGGRSEDTAH
jgi:dipeptidyl aminopeptidase/acylaminoacyl peptidase